MAADRGEAPRALVLCAHGSGGGSAAAEGLATILKEREEFDRVEVCCLKGSPGVADALQAAAGHDIVLVPLLMAEGYTYDVVLRGQLSDAGAAAAQVRLSRPVGVHPHLADIAVTRAGDECGRKGWSLNDVHIVVAAHGTPKHRATGDSARALAVGIEALGVFNTVQVAFLESPPSIEDALRAAAPEPCVVVGFFLDGGDHAESDVPAAIARAYPAAGYTGAIGRDPALADIVVDLAADRPGPALELIGGPERVSC